ncbi:zinc finger protein 567-like isoform X2 [Dermacentor albipictus]|uniref:zinc finger protein 567-like isoform X2 n=1 Tax=Dermacentor albipictus TaxID=60249 RepID=UPI0038FC9AE0
MAEKCNNGNTPPAFTFDGEETPSTSQEFFEGTSCTSDCSTMTSDDFFEDLWNAFKSLSYSEDVTGHTCVTESGISSSPPMASSSSSSHPQPSTSHAGREETSAIPENIASISEDAWKYQWNTQPTPITGGTCNVGGVTDNGCTSSQHLRTISSIDNARPSTSLACMEEASANCEDCTTCRNATGTGGRELQEFGGVCGNVPSGRSALHGYPMEPTGDTANIYKASGESSLKQSKLAEHCRKRSRKNHKCESCGKQFYRSDHLVRHYRTHTDERPYKCEICDKMFRRSSNLDVHKRIHVGERPYKCETCDKSFSQRSTLRKHQLTHSDERPHVCFICTRAFKAKESLKRHLTLNGRYGALVCDMCNLSFPDNSGLSHHHQSMHGDKTPH